MTSQSITYIDDFVSVDSIVTVFYVDMSNVKMFGESHDFWEFIYIDKGKHHLMLDGVRYDLTDGELLVYKPNAYHTGIGEHSVAQAAIVSFESNSSALNVLPGKVFTLNASLKSLLSQIITDGVDSFVPAPPETGLYGLMKRDDVPDYELQKLKHRLEMFLTELCLYKEDAVALSGSIIHENYKKEQFNKIVSYMKDNLHKAITLEELCCEFSVSMSTLKAVFKEEAGKSVISYFTYLKIKEAKRLIRETSLNFTQISEKLGFNTVHYFSKIFKEKTGVTPSEYSKSIYKK